ncbi:PadR family transcriptional regulator [Cryptosporangium sp. NPDC048952]|uniref:PadR family transcriptional regulator n=1 Tax=Cryptosporangium sp. NPDC048952 TaxID=3363961 RepID=UPI00371C4D90
MNREPQLPLTETVFYILLALTRPAHGYLIMSRVDEMSAGQVRLAPGTLYGALETLGKQNMIVRVPSADPRRKVYQLTEIGAKVLAHDAQRMAHMIRAFEREQGGAGWSGG